MRFAVSYPQSSTEHRCPLLLNKQNRSSRALIVLTMTIECREVLLSPDERYEIYCLKSAERPQLLPTFEDSDASNETNDYNADEKSLPLMDGCDIPSWRSHDFVIPHSLLQAALHVGLGCLLLRRESQIPFPETCSDDTRWKKLRSSLMKQPTSSSVERISCLEASKIITGEQDSIRPKKKFSKWEEANHPVIITGCTEPWNLETWKFDSLLERFGHVRWRFSDTHGTLLSLDTYSKYIYTEGMLDDAPLGIYDSEFGDADSPMQELIHDYSIPPCFSDDLFALADACENSEREDNLSTSTNASNNPRPPWRWVLMGPPRSGTGLHIDPLWTNAWVTLLEGTKRWILIPPNVVPHLPVGAGLQEPQIPSAIWFRNYYEQVSQLEGVVEILQQAGETVFVPNGWPHLVINLERTVAVTHNYASEFGPFERMWNQVARDEPEFGQRWYRGLCQRRPDLASRIQHNNGNDGDDFICLGLH